MPRTPDWSAGHIAEIELLGAWAYAKVIRYPLAGFYAARPERIADVSALKGERLAFRIWVRKYAIGKKGWPVIGSLPVSGDESAQPLFFKKDPISGRFAKYRDSMTEEIPATAAECAGLECAAVWDPSHVESRLRDELAGRPNKWFGSMKAK